MDTMEKWKFFNLFARNKLNFISCKQSTWANSYVQNVTFGKKNRRNADFYNKRQLKTGCPLNVMEHGLAKSL